MGLPDCLRPPSMALATVGTVAFGLKWDLLPAANEGPLAAVPEAPAPDDMAAAAADEAMAANLTRGPRLKKKPRTTAYGLYPRGGKR